MGKLSLLDFLLFRVKLMERKKADLVGGRLSVSQLPESKFLFYKALVSQSSVSLSSGSLVVLRKRLSWTRCLSPCWTARWLRFRQWNTR